MQKPFPCAGPKCAACCRRVEGLKGLPVKPGTTECLHLENGKCSIYETRPDVCRVDVMLDMVADRKLWYDRTVKLCNEFQEEDGIDEKYRLEQGDD